MRIIYITIILVYLIYNLSFIFVHIVRNLIFCYPLLHLIYFFGCSRPLLVFLLNILKLSHFLLIVPRNFTIFWNAPFMK